MPSVQVKNVPVAVHRALTAQATARGQSLQEYLLAVLATQAETARLEDVMARAARLSGRHTGFVEAVGMLREDRDSR